MAGQNANYSDCITFMQNQNIRTIADWNTARERAKEIFTDSVIYRLDSERLVSKLVKK